MIHIISNARDAPIFFKYMLDIHRNIVNESLAEKLIQNIWSCPIRIEFYKKSKRSDSKNKILETPMYCWFPTTDRDSLQNPLSFFKKLKECLFLNISVTDHCYFFRKNEFRIMTIGTSEIASRSKHYTSYFPRIIEK